MKYYWSLLALVPALLLGCSNAGNASHQSSVPPITQSSASPTIAQSTITEPASVIKSGTFVAAEQPTEGGVRIVTSGGKSVLELDPSFMTSDKGPDLVVLLHKSADVLGTTQPPNYPLNEADYVILGPLQKFSGAQQYAIPDNINLTEYRSAVIWCRKFNATFGTASFNQG